MGMGNEIDKKKKKKKKKNRSRKRKLGDSSQDQKEIITNWKEGRVLLMLNEKGGKCQWNAIAATAAISSVPFSLFLLLFPLPDP